MNTQNTNKVLQTQIVAQWITSLAISVICCAVLFIVFAGYIVELQSSNNLLTVKLEHLEERHTMLMNEFMLMKRPPQIVQMQPPAALAPPQTQPVAPAASPELAVSPSAPAPAAAPSPVTVNPVPPPASVPAPVVPSPQSEKSLPEPAVGSGEGILVPEESIKIDTPALSRPSDPTPALPTTGKKQHK